MKLQWKQSLLALVSAAALVPTASPARTVGAPVGGTVLDTTYYTSGAFHGAVDIQASSCQTPFTPGVVGSLAWNVTIRSTVTGCGSSITTPNEVAHTFATGWTFRIRGFLKSAGSYDRTCDRCSIGTAYVFFGGAIVHPTHVQYDRQGTLSTAWYAGTTRGEALSPGEVVGYID